VTGQEMIVDGGMTRVSRCQILTRNIGTCTD
jgi:hypothetical protein